jgi:cytochrome c biogenesis protein
MASELPMTTRVTTSVRNAVWELLGSMRFAISALSVVAIASIIGTLLRQREPYPNYVNQFGPFWADIFRSAGVYEVYNAWWFIAIMAFLVASTSVCVIRNAPKFLREMRSFQTHVRVSSLRAMPNRGELVLPGALDTVRQRIEAALALAGYKVKLDTRAEGELLAAKAGSANKLGYVFAHAGIVVVCLGGLADSELPLRAAVKWLGKTPMPASTTVDQIKAEYRLPEGNPSYRANLFVVEGQKSDLAMVNSGDGTYLQDLPFSIALKKFRVEYYSTGMPKLFASDVEVTNKVTGATRSATIKVNEPLFEQGIAVYQSSFDDGGSKLKLTALPLDGSAQTFEVNTEVGGAVPLSKVSQEQKLSLEVIGFRPINVENLKQTIAMAAGSEQNKFKESVATVLSPSGGAKQRDLRNVGPTVQYKLRDASGQAREFNVYMLPVELEGDRVFLAGMRDVPNEPFRYLRIPADDKDEMTQYIALRQALANDGMRLQAAQRFGARAIAAPAPGSVRDPKLQEQLTLSAGRALDTFARGGLQEVANTIEKSVPKAEQEKAADVFIRVLTGAMWDLWQISRVKANLPEAAPDDVASMRYIQNAQTALSDGFLLGTPLLFQVNDFEHIQASVLQVTKSPGKRFVYLGCLMLVFGVFTMFFIRERRLWCWLAPEADGQSTRLVFAMSAQRKTLQTEQEFERLRAQLSEGSP